MRDTSIRHDNIRDTNIIVVESHAQIIDFGWACWREESGDDTLPFREDKEAMEGLLLAVEGEIS
jgi:tRNA A-37 threonylcarbamoyl transferase component Bud32